MSDQLKTETDRISFLPREGQASVMVRNVPFSCIYSNAACIIANQEKVSSKMEYPIEIGLLIQDAKVNITKLNLHCKGLSQGGGFKKVIIGNE